MPQRPKAAALYPTGWPRDMRTQTLANTGLKGHTMVRLFVSGGGGAPRAPSEHRLLGGERRRILLWASTRPESILGTYNP